MNLAIKPSRYFVIFIFLSSILLIAACQIPLVEGDKTIIEGKAYGFEIGAKKSDTFKVIKKEYNKKGYYLRTLWLKKSELGDQLTQYENQESKKSFNEYAEYKDEISNMLNLTAPLNLCQRWDIKMPAKWVNDIYLTFDDGRLIKIRKSRWLFERP